MIMSKINFKALIPHLIAVLIFIVSIFAYFPELLDGKGLKMDDIDQHKGMSNELADYRERIGEEAIWTNAMFSGMPGYLISTVYKGNLTRFIDKLMKIGLPRPADYMFVMMLGFYFLLFSFGVKPSYAIIGALAYGFSTYNLLIIQAGHMSKVDAMSYMPWVLMGIVVAFNHHRIWGAILTALFLSLQIKASHFQITYYFAFIVGFYGLYLLWNAISEKKVADFSRTIAMLFVAAILAVCANFSSLYTVYDYGKDSIRGQSELTDINGDKTSGLDKSYATQYSYGKGETFTYLMPNVYGGASNIALGENKDNLENVDPRYKNMVAQLPQFWGEFSTTGPFYAGAIILFLFVLGLFTYNNRKKWFFAGLVLLVVLLAWGKYFMPLTDFMLDHFPGYNKFRAVKMILVIVDFLLPLLGIIALYQFVKDKELFTKHKVKFYIAYGITAGICLLFWLMPDSFIALDSLGEMLEDNIRSTFTRQGADEAEISQYLVGLSENVAIARANVVQSEAMRSFGLISVAAVLIFIYARYRFNELLFVVLIGALIVGDITSVGKRFVNKSDFVNLDKVKIPFTASKADVAIYTMEVQKDPTLNAKINKHLEDGLKNEPKKAKNDAAVRAKYQFRGLLANTNYRILNLTTSTFNDAATSFFHKSVGGYSAVKLKRYQEFIEQHLTVNMQTFIQALNSGYNDSTLKDNLSRKYALNMLNTKYIIISKDIPPIVNSSALGNAWFVSELEFVKSPDDEINSLGSFDPAVKAIADERFKGSIQSTTFTVDETNTSINLQAYAPNELVYTSNNSNEGLAVFSEIYYAKGWNAYIDGKMVEHLRVNYLLRALPIPAGKHEIVFKFEPSIYHNSEKVAYASSALILLFLLGFSIFSARNIIKKES